MKGDNKMEATAAKAYTGEIKTLADKVNEYIKREGKTITDLASTINYSRTTVSRYLSGKYDSDATELEAKLTAFLAEVTGEELVAATAERAKVVNFTKRKSFFESRDAQNIIGVCNSCQEYIGLGIVVGKSGFGKTHALKYYSKMPRVAYIECDDTMSSRDLVESIERALGIPTTYGTIWKRVNGIREFFNVNRGYLLIIDEADKLISKYTQKKMEILRAIFDQSDVGMVIAGEPKLEAQIKSYLTRFANRVDFYASLKGLSGKEVDNFLEGYEVEEDALAELKSRACNHQTGCFRLLDRTLNNVFRIMKERGESRITLTIINQASNMMML
ncbi:transcriptional regulator, XRE family [Syntrophobotulus glycolicus DSM 8271]|uniref:Transcriptional regulator, XRE family n=2 Tax=Syntrophobotulus TaxID=51196 RepID=F0SX53_SYNGF|nr:transcriptional regulator, XRE family [Syntrophobotulus glycolicus DSM 8271]ADY56913.1 transcriptional regulator, XRE family [Syntrophobotulus glycolicus DSM 8271]ADY57250.1 transcriptional regulator, XRE family [Syntrophobotulus glycolicus DSM 8271]ADY57422.1 transcriptional regulator, XRE family [Syntrophobotulus glycolicus DSM 8271]